MLFAIMDEQPEQEDDADAVTLQPMTGHVELKDVTFGYTPDKVILKEYQFVCKAWTEDRFCWFYRCRKDHDHQPSEIVSMISSLVRSRLMEWISGISSGMS